MSSNSAVGKIPAPLAAIPFTIPRLVERRLDNGLRVVLLRNTKLPLLNIRLVSHYGEVNDAPDRNGIIGAMASLLTEGAGGLSSKEIAERIENIGATIGSSSSSDSMGVSVSCLSHHLEEVLHILSETILRPTFPENEVALFKANTLEGLKYQRAQPSFLADERFSKEIYGIHPYSRVSPLPEVISAIVREDLTSAHSAIGVSNCTLLIVGDFNEDSLLPLLERSLGGLPQGRECSNDFPVIAERNSRRLILVDRKGSAQSNIVMGNLGVSRTHPDFFPLMVMNQILGAGASSRLFMNLREEKGYTYGAYSKFSMRRFAGDFEASAEVRTEVTAASIKEFLMEMNRIRVEEVSETELTDAKNYMTGVFPLRLETQEGLTGALLQQIVYGLHEDYLHDYRAMVDSVTKEDVLRVAKEWIRPDSFTTVIVGDADAVKDDVLAFADELEVYSVDGVRMS